VPNRASIETTVEIGMLRDRWPEDHELKARLHVEVTGAFGVDPTEGGTAENRPQGKRRRNHSPSQATIQLMRIVLRGLIGAVVVDVAALGGSRAAGMP
jgi:hypothetical protein